MTAIYRAKADPRTGSISDRELIGELLSRVDQLERNQRWSIITFALLSFSLTMAHLVIYSAQSRINDLEQRLEQLEDRHGHGDE